jgi:hypothetical protein
MIKRTIICYLVDLEKVGLSYGAQELDKSVLGTTSNE